MRRIFGLVAAIVITSAGCKESVVERTEKRAGEWPATVGVSVLSVKQVFDDNWVVNLAFKNESDDVFVLSDLTESQAYVTFTDGSKRPIHEKSVGKSKKVLVPLKSLKTVPFLFGASNSRPKEVVLKGKRVAIGSS